MATLDHTANETPADLVWALSLVIGASYAIQNIDPRDRVYVKTATAAPSRTDRAFILQPFEFSYPSADVGEGIYVWTDLGRTAAIVVERA